MNPVPLRQRKIDLIFLAFFVVNLTFVTYIVDLETLVIADPANFDYPLWPPAPLVDLIHWYGETFDPLLLARPPFWQMTIWIDVLLFGPFYAFAMYAFIRGRDWIRIPAFVWSGMMLSNVLIILMDEVNGVTPAHNLPFVLAVNAPWLLMPLAMIARLRREHPFSSRTAGTPAEPTAQA